MSEATLQRVLQAAGAVLLCVICLTPVAYMVVTSVSTTPEYLDAGAAFHPTTTHFRDVLASETLHFPSYLRNSVLVSALSACVAVGIAAPAAYAITRLPVPGKMGILFAVLAVSMFPQISLVSYLFKVMIRLGWINTLHGLAVPYVGWTLPLALWILVSYFQQVPVELDRAAKVDGCTPWTTLWKVILPVAAPGLVSTGLLAFIFAFNEFLFALMLTTDHHARTIPVGIALFQGLHGQTPWGTIMAASVVTCVPVVVLALLFQHRIISGLTRGAVKG